MAVRFMPKRFWQIMLAVQLLVSIVSGCSTSWPRRVPVLLPDWDTIVLSIGGVCQQIEFFDYNCDGEQDLLVVGDRQIYCFAGRDGRWSPRADLVIPFPDKIGGFDIARSPGKGNAWLVVLAGPQLFFFKDIAAGKPEQNIRYTQQATLMPSDWLFSKRYGVRMFRDIDGDTVPDLVVPFRRSLDWHFAVYLYNKGAFITRGVLDVGEARLPVPPALYVLSGESGPLLLVEGSRSLKFYQADAVTGFADRPSRQIAVSQLIPKSAGNLPPVIRAIGQLNRQGKEELILAGLTGDRIWLWYDQQQVEPLVAPGAATLLVALEDIDGDNWRDIVCVRLAAPASWQALIPYLISGKIPVPVWISVYLNHSGRFVAQASQNFARRLMVPYRHSRRQQSDPEQFWAWGDLDDDGFLDCVAVTKQGRLSLFYDVAGYIRPPVNNDRLEQLLQPVYQRALSVGIPADDADIVVAVPQWNLAIKN